MSQATPFYHLDFLDTTLTGISKFLRLDLPHMQKKYAKCTQLLLDMERG